MAETGRGQAIQAGRRGGWGDRWAGVMTVHGGHGRADCKGRRVVRNGARYPVIRGSSITKNSGLLGVKRRTVVGDYGSRLCDEVGDYGSEIFIT